MKESGLSIVRILFEVICIVVLITLMAFFGRLGNRWQVQTEQNREYQLYTGDIIELENIANPNRTYTPSEVAEIIVTYGNKYEYIVDSQTELGDKTEHFIITDSDEHEKAKHTAENLLNSGRYQLNFDTEGDKFTYIYDYMWSADYLLDEVCLIDDIDPDADLSYTVEILIPNPTNLDEWLVATGDEAFPENLVNNQFRIHYTPV